MNAQPARLITFEGIDRCGKSLQAQRAVEWLEQCGYQSALTSEPGGLEGFCAQLRQILMEPDLPRHPLTAAMVFSADRHEHVHSFIAPKLKDGCWIVCDRFHDSLAAYQGGGDGVDAQVLQQLGELACAGLKPDLTILLQISPAVSSKRSGKADYYDRNIEYLQKVANRYDELADAEPERFAKIAADADADEVWQNVRAVIESRLLAS